MRWFLAIIALSMPVPAVAAGMVVMPVKFLDTSKEATDQAAAHQSRLELLTRVLTEGLKAEAVAPAAVAAACPTFETPECLIDAAAEANGSKAVFVVVHKSSTLIMQAFVQVMDVEDERVLMKRELNFRGDNDEAWRRVGGFIVEQISSELVRSVAK